MAEEIALNNETSSSNNMKDNFCSDYKTLGDFMKDGYKHLMEGIKHSNCLPSDRDWNFYSTFDSFKKVMSHESHEIINSINVLLAKNDICINMNNHTLENKSELLIDANDTIFERIASNIDEMNGIKKSNHEPVLLQTVSAQLPPNINGSWNKTINATFSVSPTTLNQLGVNAPLQLKGNTIRLLTAENITRPQKLFKDKIDNRNGIPWEPRIKEKPNSLKPLSIFLEESENGQEFSHPYEFELDRFSPSQNHLNKITVIKPKLLSETPLVEIDKTEQLQELVEELRCCNVIAVDLEHHSYRSFMGITCLLQISTPKKDYLIDTLALRSDLWVLNEIFTKPDIIKVFHGGISDIMWLQRDLSLYVVNMFDTHIAAKQLEYPALSLAYLIRKFCNFVPNKQFQLADWRIRPLPDELKNYAREDTHYLIYIYQNMRNELLDRANGQDNLLRSVIQQSTELCKKRYFKPHWHENSHFEFYRRCNRVFDSRQMFALKEIYKWRDNISREEDESIGYVLPNNMLLEIAERLPKEMQGILACCCPVPPLVRANLLEIHKIILKALERPFEEPILKEDTRGKGTTKKISKINEDSPLHCPHDLTKSEEFRDDLPTALSATDPTPENKTNNIPIEQSSSSCSVFGDFEEQVLESAEHSIKPDKCRMNTVFVVLTSQTLSSSRILFGRSTSIGSVAVKHCFFIGGSFDKRPYRVITLVRVNLKLSNFRNNFKFLSPYERYKLIKPFVEAKEKRLAEEKAKKLEEKKDQNESINAVQEDTRTDEERIDSIREHFLHLSRLSISPQTGTTKKKSLTEIGRGEKRKRDKSVLCGTSEKISEKPLQLPVPNLRITLHTDDSLGPTRETSLQTNEPINEERTLKRAKVMENTQLSEAVPAISDTQKTDDQVDQSSMKNTTKKDRRKFRGNRSRASNSRNGNQTDQSFNAYDYSMVDFRQFQGGAQSVQKTKVFKSKFRGKNQQKRRGAPKDHNKAMTIGRSRGR